jgi:hypothetical protein
MNRINERARGVAGAGGLRVSAGYSLHSTIPRSCGRCGWAGDDLDTRIIKSWFPSSPSYCDIWFAGPRCSAWIERR